MRSGHSLMGGTRRIAIRGGMAIVLLAIVWFFTSRWCALAIDQIYTPRLATLQSTPIGWNGVWLQFGPGIANYGGPKGGSGDDVFIGGQIVDFTGPGPDYRDIASLVVEAGGQLVLHKGGSSFIFGPRAGTVPGGDDVIPAFAAGPGDETSVTVDRSLLSWPAPFELNFMTGVSPSWQRYLYYRLAWQKPSGARLSIVWRYRQDYYSVGGWDGQEEGADPDRDPARRR